MDKILVWINNPRRFFNGLLLRLACIFPDKLYLSLMMKVRCGYWPNWNNPHSFNEKLQWLKLYDRCEEYTSMVDKYSAKKIVTGKIGEEFIIPTLKVWNDVDDIDIESLPDQFVLKTTHGGGSYGVIICKSKQTFDFQSAKIKLKRSLKQNLYVSLREWPYKNVEKRIIAEKYIEDKTGNLSDYKVMCFGGEPKLIQIHLGRNNGIHTQDFYDINWNKLELNQVDCINSSITISRPSCFDNMISFSKILSKGIPQLRVDWYVVDNHLYFGEMTFFDASGFDEFIPSKYNRIIGDWITLPEKRK